MHTFYSKLSDYRKKTLLSDEASPRLKQLFKLYFLLMNAQSELSTDDLADIHKQECFLPENQEEVLHQLWFNNALARYNLYILNDTDRAISLTEKNIQNAEKLFENSFEENDKDKKSIIFILALNVVRLSFYENNLSRCRLQLSELKKCIDHKSQLSTGVFSHKLTSLINVHGMDLLKQMAEEDYHYFNLKLNLIESRLHKNLLESFESISSKDAEGIFVTDFDSGIKYSWADTNKTAGQIAAKINQNVKYVLICTKQSILFPSAILACWKMDKTPVMVHENYTAFELEQLTNYTSDNVSQVLLDDSYDSRVVEKYRKVFSHVTLINASATDSCKFPVPEDYKNMALGLFTSGTSGPSKFCLFSHENLIEAARIESSNEPLFHNGIIANLRPHYTSAGMNTLWPALLTGSQLVFSEKIRKTPISRFLNEMLEKISPSILVLSPTYIISMFQDEESYPFTAKKLPLYFGGSSLPEKILKTLLKNNFIPSMRYGMTEVAHIISKKTYSEDFWQFDKSDAGIPFKNVFVSIKSGFLKVSTKGVVSKVIEGERESIIANGFITADRAEINSSGSIILEGRDNRTISINGFRFHSQQVEDVLMTSEKILDCRVLGTKDENNQETLQAFILIKNKNVSTETIQSELKKLAQEKLSGFKQPSEYIFLTEWPSGVNGKIDFKKLV